MSARSKARKRALDILFEADAKGIPIQTVLADSVRRRSSAGEPELNPYTVQLVEAIAANRDAVDDRIRTHLDSWDLQRLPSVDRSILRIGAYEVLFAEDMPDGVAIAEAVELAKSLSTDESPAFINGVLGGISRGASAPTAE
jgi:N utilization substance protein B